ncbi:MAG: hypothetical protein U9N59_10195 [Campylobacterota bacterium]|nr:hypothetical protein [Campylobacterota bacterium]
MLRNLRFKNIVFIILMTYLLIGCTNNNLLVKTTTANNQEHKKIEEREELEQIISYQDIIVKINDINTKKKSNKRIKEIVKEYRYNTSDDDSKNSARKKALSQVKLIILEEIGVFVEGYLELSKTVENEKYHKYFKQEIKNLTAGIIKTKILNEKYDGKTYYVKASVLVDPDSVSEGISEILKIKANKSEINKLTKLLKTKEQEIDMRSSETISLQKKITNQELLNSAKQEELKAIQLKLQKAQNKLTKYQREETLLNNKLSKIERQVYNALERQKKKTQKACSVRRGILKNDVISIIGSPDAIPCGSNTKPSNFSINYRNCNNWYYGNSIITFNDAGIVSSISGCY